MKAFCVAALLGFSAGCASASSPGVGGDIGGCKGNGCGHSGVATIGGQSGGTSAGSGSSGGTTAGGSSGGTTGAASSGSGGTTGAGSTSQGGNGDCPFLPSYPPIGGCPTGSFESAVVDFFTCAPIAGATIQAIEANGVPATGSVTSAADGTFVLCDPPSSAFTAAVSAPTYATIYGPEYQPNVTHLSSGVSLPPTTIVSELEFAVPGGANPADGVLLAQVETGAGCSDPSGWTLTLTNVDGGALPDGGALVTYLGTSAVPDPSLTATSSQGLAFIYDIDLSSSSYFSVALTKPDAGACAFALDTATYTGRLLVTTEGVTFDPLALP